MRGASIETVFIVVLAIVMIAASLAIILPRLSKGSKSLESAEDISKVKDPSIFVDVCKSFYDAYYLPEFFNSNQEMFAKAGSFCSKNGKPNWKTCTLRCSFLLYFHDILSKRSLMCSDIADFCSRVGQYFGGEDACRNRVISALKSNMQKINIGGKEYSLVCSRMDNSGSSYEDYCTENGNPINNDLCDPYNVNDPMYVENIRALAAAVQSMIS